ncbi:MAG: uracil-DNA glycosylase [Oscillospiraceae bacterium]|nr:uracil-DNA glycosylase [Oscillospiraceae bacterium]
MTWDELEESCKNCTKCELHKTRTTCVFGCGSRTAKLMFVGEAPGEKEDLSGIPFVGVAGKMFDKFLFAVGIDREEVYIANMLKCRPPNNRDPSVEEQDMCIEYLREQVRLIKPKLIVCLGRISAMRLIKPDFKITSEHGQWIEKGGFKMCAVYHPSLLLRDARKKEDMLIDMKNVKAKLDAEEKNASV